MSIAKNTIPNLMKKYLFIFCLLLSSATYAQTNQIREEYCEFTVDNAPGIGQCSIRLDYGQRTTGIFGLTEKLRDEQTGKIIRFNSAIEALNYLARSGWKLVNAYNTLSDGDGEVHYLMRKEVVMNQDEPIR